MKRRRRERRHLEDNENFWPAFTDMISTVVLILFFLVLVFYMEDISHGHRYASLKEQADQTTIQLGEKEKALAAKENQLNLLELELEAKLLEIDRVNSELEARQADLLIADGAIADQALIIQASNEKLDEMQAQLQGLSVLSVEILNKVKESIEDELGEYNESGQPIVTIGDTGNIVINESLVFDTNSSEIKPEGQVILDNLAIAFENVLKNDEIRSFIDAIAIQGHTDSRSSHQYNRELSAKRAYNVVNYLLDSNEVLAEEYGAYFTASAYSEFRLIDQGTTDQAHAKNRRIEIAVILKDAQIQKIIQEYLRQSLEGLD